MCEFVAGEEDQLSDCSGSPRRIKRAEVGGFRLNTTTLLTDSWKGWSHLNRFVKIQRTTYEDDTRAEDEAHGYTKENDKSII